ncbi:MAG: hypothetical protein COA97_11740 [Flavobacteriales bacterium]|nr:MAG: hypothetical protein COA97_11740 [Flavobacteriales bacterium]
MKRLLPILFLLIVGCFPDSAEEVVNSLTSPKEMEMEEDLKRVRVKLSQEDSSFQQFYSRFVMSLLIGNRQEMHKFVSPENGVYMIESPGALPLISKTYQLAEFKLQNDSSVWMTNIDVHIMMEDLVFETLPKVICDEEIYDKQGCFAQEINPLLESQIWNYAGLNEKQIQAIEFLVKTVEITVVNTSNFIFYFSKIEGKWFLTFLDVRTPCAA